MAEEVQNLPVVAVTAAVGAIVLLFVLLLSFLKTNDKDQVSEDKETKDTNGSIKSQPQKRQKAPVRIKKESKVAFMHPWLASSLKGHSANVLGLDFSPNGKYLATCAEDRTVLLWSVKEFSQKQHKSLRTNVELDHATQVKFSPDSRAFITCLSMTNTVRVYKMNKKSDGSTAYTQGSPEDFPQKHSADIINIGIASTGRFIMTCSKDTTIRIWDLKGDVLANIDTHQVNNSYGATSPCGRFVASSGFTPDVKVWEVCFDKSGNFKEVTRAFELKGHSAGVYSFSFNNDSTKMASVSKDGTWKLWDTDVRYQLGQDPYLLKTGSFNHTGKALIALSHDAMTVAIATAYNISLYSTTSMECQQSIDNPHNECLQCLAFDNNSKYLVSTGDKQIHVFHNVIGYQATISDCQEKKKKAKNGPHKERLQQQIDEASEALKNILNTEEH